MNNDVTPLPLTAQYHAVRFYDNAKSLAQIVAEFLSDGLAAGNPGIVVATPAHRGAILKELTARLLDVSSCSVQVILSWPMPTRHCPAF